MFGRGVRRSLSVNPRGSGDLDTDYPMTPDEHQLVARVAGLLAKSERVLLITGAGLSADSGLPTYRGIGGLYDIELTEEGLPIEEVLSGEMLARDPALTWKYFLQIAEAARGAGFNRGHQVIAQLEQALPSVWTLTQNVDGLHRSAGSRNLIEIHGSMHDLRCTHCGEHSTSEQHDWSQIPPHCWTCGSVVRPNVILFGEMLPQAAQERFWNEWNSGFDLVVSVGTSSLFPYIAGPVEWASRDGIPTVEINPSETPVSELVTIRLAMRAAPALDAIWRWYCEALGGK